MTKKNEQKIYICTFNSISFPVSVLTVLLSDLQLQITLTQQVMTLSLAEEVR